MLRHTSFLAIRLLSYLLVCTLLFPGCGGGGGSRASEDITEESPGTGETDDNEAPELLFPEAPENEGSEPSRQDKQPTTCEIRIDNVTDRLGNRYTLNFTCRTSAAGVPVGSVTTCSVAIRTTDGQSTVRSSSGAVGNWQHNRVSSGQTMQDLTITYESLSGSEAFRVQLLIHSMQVNSRRNDKDGNIISFSGSVSEADAMIEAPGIIPHPAPFSLGGACTITATYL